jgi:hypothetical protein
VGEASNEGCNSDPTGHDFTDKLYYIFDLFKLDSSSLDSKRVEHGLAQSKSKTFQYLISTIFTFFM